ncbi:LysR family transcriptional regulator [Paraburkholderia silvatlantica]|uniref:DNA-binding transcriptional LysR family regulator n=1 Tax=Paraburkholderia silvatlantica TaxID=321895 RepID=A0A2U1A4W2_9BURK|nr:LysR family transcriptional regulator [Paraburkholderia silvatlantica]MBB2931579.1 DNA-binding transcriptional LysR family regulator [Paraburkholderia silvatlantica]PVY26630.1 LysR family transcriptional regulator [Paraburkholderia silvatlantica]PXW32895.1 LysR family transcriptional regulator [Paraburkholderia silvatlantica]PYE14446.1 LysR family transcriptional regulator [Paraburkholderia silvatlantica]TDQ81645.1 LysR family transcriptional regulator [Paraburkholderia silvatlantica]
MNLLEAMRIYTLAVERGSISGAARDANIGQPAASERIERLEKYLGCRLLLRNARTFKCTPEGEIFYARSRKILAAAEQAVAEVRSDGHTLRGTIRIGAPHCLGEVLLPSALGFVREAYPQLDIDLALNDRIVDLFAEGIDISFRQGPVDEGTFHAYHLGQVKRLLVASSEYLAQHAPIAEPSDLVEHAFIRIRSMFATGHLPLVDESAKRDNVAIRTTITTNHWNAMYQMIKDGLGIGVVEAFACVDAIASGELVPLLSQHCVPSQDLHLLVRAHRPTPMRVRTVTEIMKQCVPELLGTLTVNGSDRESHP